LLIIKANKVLLILVLLILLILLNINKPKEGKIEEESLRYNFSFENNKCIRPNPSFKNKNQINDSNMIITPMTNYENHEEELKILKLKSLVLFLKEFGLSTYEFYNQNEKTILQDKDLINDVCECVEYQDQYNSQLSNTENRNHLCPNDKWNFYTVLQNKHLM